MKRIVALFLAVYMILPVFAAQPTADPDTGDVPTGNQPLTEADLAPKAL